MGYAFLILLISFLSGGASAYLIGDVVALGKYLGFCSFMGTILGTGLMIGNSR
jgi:uncharacterized membrane protein (DUF485 family)